MCNLFVFAHVKAGPTFVDEQDDCTYVFEWKTSLVCQTVQAAVDCTVDDDKGNHFDFTDLINDDVSVFICIMSDPKGQLQG